MFGFGDVCNVIWCVYLSSDISQLCHVIMPHVSNYRIEQSQYNKSEYKGVRTFVFKAYYS